MESSGALKAIVIMESAISIRALPRNSSKSASRASNAFRSAPVNSTVVSALRATASMIVVPRDTPGIKIVKMLHVFGYDDAPHGHAEVVYDNVRVPKSAILLGEGRGFEIAQGRLGPGRIHHCMRAIGVAERALEMAIKRAKSRVAFGQRISEMGVTKAHVADMRMEIDMARLLVLKAAWAMDKFGNKEARQQIAMIKVAVPNISSKVVDRCLQLHGAGGVSQVFKLASMYAHQRTLRLADGPDEVHRDQVGRMEIAKYN